MTVGSGGEREELSLSDATGRLLDECRMVLPGIQALFGRAIALSLAVFAFCTFATLWALIAARLRSAAR